MKQIRKFGLALVAGLALLLVLAPAVHWHALLVTGTSLLAGTAILSGAWDTKRMDGEVLAVPVTASKTVYQGALLVWDAAGNVEPLVGNVASQPANFAGVARTGAKGGGDSTQADSLAAAGTVLVERRGVFFYNTDDGSPYIGQPVFGITDNFVSSVAGATSIAVGTIVEIPGDGTVGVQISNSVK